MQELGHVEEKEMKGRASLEVLLTSTAKEFEERACLYVSHVEPVRARMEQAIADGLLPQDEPFKKYAVFVRWAIRQLEYSYVLKRLLGREEQNVHVLDAGCGVSPFPNALSRLGHRVVAVDANSQIIELLRKSNANSIYDSEVEYRCENITGMPFPDSSFDFVYSLSVLEHLEGGAAKEAMHEFVRLIKPGGAIAVTVDYRPFPSIPFRILQFLNDLRLGRLNHRPANRPFDERTLEPELLSAIPAEFCPDEDLLVRTPRVRPRDVRRFWKDHRFPGCLYDKPRAYTSIGIALQRY